MKPLTKFQETLKPKKKKPRNPWATLLTCATIDKIKSALNRVIYKTSEFVM